MICRSVTEAVFAAMDEKRQTIMKTALSGRSTGDRAVFCCVPD